MLRFNRLEFTSVRMTILATKMLICRYTFGNSLSTNQNPVTFIYEQRTLSGFTLVSKFGSPILALRFWHFQSTKIAKIGEPKPESQIRRDVFSFGFSGFDILFNKIAKIGEPKPESQNWREVSSFGFSGFGTKNAKT